jgi:hypothetical protein
MFYLHDEHIANTPFFPPDLAVPFWHPWMDIPSTFSNIAFSRVLILTFWILVAKIEDPLESISLPPSSSPWPLPPW